MWSTNLKEPRNVCVGLSGHGIGIQKHHVVKGPEVWRHECIHGEQRRWVATCSSMVLHPWQTHKQIQTCNHHTAAADEWKQWNHAMDKANLYTCIFVHTFIWIIGHLIDVSQTWCYNVLQNGATNMSTAYEIWTKKAIGTAENPPASNMVMVHRGIY